MPKRRRAVGKRRLPSGPWLQSVRSMLKSIPASPLIPQSRWSLVAWNRNLADAKAATHCPWGVVTTGRSKFLLIGK